MYKTKEHDIYFDLYKDMYCTRIIAHYKSNNENCRPTLYSNTKYLKLVQLTTHSIMHCV